VKGIGVNEVIPTPESLPASERAIAEEAYQYMKLTPGAPIKGTKIDVCFVGSCTNGRISDLREAAKFAQGHRVAPHVKAFIVPGSERVKKQAEAEIRSALPPPIVTLKVVKVPLPVVLC